MIKIDEYFKFNHNDRIVVGCSTGPDSMALVDMLLKIREKYNLFLIIAHVNHNVRKESFEEADFIEKYCEENLAKYMLPKKFIVIKEFPKTMIGKIDYKELEKMYKGEK